MKRAVILFATILSSITLGASAFIVLPKRLIWNTSASAPIGLYAVQPADALEVTDLVAVVAPPLIAEFMADRRYLPFGVPMMKRVLALPGQVVCRDGLDIFVHGAVIGRARERDKADRKMPSWRGCRRIADDEIFLMNWDAADSVDGRYFGPFARGYVIGRVRPVWTDEAGNGHFEWWADTR
jgi:conjugative transfer signal peptidase TraF